MWCRAGDIKTISQKDGGILYRTVEYHDRLPDSTPRLQLAVTSYANKTASFILSADSESIYSTLTDFYVEAGFPNPDYLDCMLKTIPLLRASREDMVDFLKVIKKFDASFSSIEAEVCDFLHIDLRKTYRINYKDITLTHEQCETSFKNMGIFGVSTEVAQTVSQPQKTLDPAPETARDDTVFSF